MHEMAFHDPLTVGDPEYAYRFDRRAPFPQPFDRDLASVLRKMTDKV